MAISRHGDAIATASVGSEGAIGTIAGTGFVRAFTRAMVQAPGVASQIAVSHFRRAVSKSEAINDLLTRADVPGSANLVVQFGARCDLALEPVAVGSEGARQGRHHLVQPGTVGRNARAAPLERDIGRTDASIAALHKLSTRTNPDR